MALYKILLYTTNKWPFGILYCIKKFFFNSTFDEKGHATCHTQTTFIFYLQNQANSRFLETITTLSLNLRSSSAIWKSWSNFQTLTIMSLGLIFILILRSLFILKLKNKTEKAFSLQGLQAHNDRVLIASPKPPRCLADASPGLPQGISKASPRPPQSFPNALVAKD